MTHSHTHSVLIEIFPGELELASWSLNSPYPVSEMTYTVSNGTLNSTIPSSYPFIVELRILLGQA